MIVVRAWLTARTWRELAYLVSGVFLGLPTFVLAMVGAVTAAASVLTVGLPLLVGVLALARLTPRYFRGPARKLLGWDWADPPPPVGGSWWGRVRALPSDPTAWRALTYCLARWPLAVVGAYPGLFAVVVAPVGITYPLWWFLVPGDVQAFEADTWSQTWIIALQGLAVLLATPWWLRLIVLIDRFLVRSLLHPSEAQRRIAELEAGRAALQSDAAALLRRVERDLHDGTQARLVALGLTLSRIENRSTEEPVRKLAADARGTVTEALAELRDIVRGMHPPALDDGLEVALTTLAARSAVPAEVTVSLPGRPPDATASALYFAVAELLTNVARHANASRVRVDLRTENRCLRLTVTDDGHGGASVITPGSAPAATAGRDRPKPEPGASRSGTAPHEAGTAQTATAPHETNTPWTGTALHETNTPRTGTAPHETNSAQTDAAAPPEPDTAQTATVPPEADASGVEADLGRSRRPAASGTGLAGLARRAAALDGSLTVDSPPGGPTAVTMVLPEIGG